MPPSHFTDGPRLLADVGGTNARFALQYSPGRIENIETLRCADYEEFRLAVQAYLEQIGHPAVRHAAIAIANPVQGDHIKMTNHDWAFSIEATRRQLQLSTFLVVNDFTALSMAVPHLKSNEYQQIGSGTPTQDSTIGLVGAGTGLGVGGLILANKRWIALNSEGGHVNFSPTNQREVAILNYCWKYYSHVSAERLISGPGLELIYAALCEINGTTASTASSTSPALTLTTPEIVERALQHADSTCLETIACFCSMLGTVAANVAVTLGALGGIYIGGGVVPRLGKYFAQSPFRSNFENKGRFTSYMQQIPTYLITTPYPAFLGVAAILEEKLQSI